MKPQAEGREVLEALRSRTAPTDGRAPIEVNALVDRQGTELYPWSSRRDYYRGLERDGVDVAFTRSSFNLAKPPIEHRKLFVIDDDVAYVGGMGMGSGSTWHDVMVRLTGKELVAQAHADFVGRWVDNGKPVSALQRQLLEAADRTGQTPVDVGYRLVANDGPVRDSTRAIYAIAHRAQDRLWMQTPYFGSAVLAAESRAAIARGADTRLWVNGDASCFPIFPQLSRTYYRDLGVGASDGVRVLQQQRMSHEKVVLTEDWATVGSTNLTYRALDTDHELNVVTNDPRLMGQVEAMMRHAEAVGRPVTAEDMERFSSRLLVADGVRPVVRKVLESMA